MLVILPRESLHTINPRFKPRGLINFMVHNHQGFKSKEGSNQDYKSTESINLDGYVDLGFIIQDLGCIRGNMVHMEERTTQNITVGGSKYFLQPFGSTAATHS